MEARNERRYEREDLWVGACYVEPQRNAVTPEGGELMSLEPKVMDVLVCLIAAKGKTVTKKRFMEAVWGDTVVSKDVLPRCISRLRKVFGDDARDPRYIETIRKAGYRLIAPVDQTAPPPVAPSTERENAGREGATPEKAEAQAAPLDAAQEETPTSSAKKRPARLPAALVQRTGLRTDRLAQRGAVFWMGALCAMALVAFFGMWWSGGKEPPASPQSAVTVPFTSFPGEEFDAEMSPAGREVAFAWNGAEGDNFDIYVKQPGAEAPLRLTTHPAPDSSPSWSPDGQDVAFVRTEERDNVIAIVPVIGGRERVLARFGARAIGGVVWSPDGQTLAVAAQRAPYEAFSVYLLDIGSRQKRRLTTPPAYYLGDTAPAFSPDGKTLAFSRKVVEHVQDIYTVPVEGGRPQRLTRDGAHISGLDWTADGERIVFASDRGGASKLWHVPAGGGTPEWIATSGGGKGLHQPSVARKGGGMTLTERSFDVNVWRTHRVAGYGRLASHPAVASTRWDSNPSVAPGGERLAFVSKRSGHFEVWTSAQDGSAPMQLTRFEGPFVSTPRWAPGGQQLIFASRRAGNSDVYAVSASGSTPRRLTTGSAADLAPSFSNDGRHVYFASNRSGAWQIWKMPSAGGPARQITMQGGFAGFEGPDGNHLYYVKKNTPGIWRRPLAVGNETDEARVVASLEPDDWGNWAVTERGIYFIRRDQGAEATLAFYAFRNQTTAHVADLGDVPRHPSLAVAPEAAWFLHTRIDRSESDIMLVENFR